MQKLKQLNVEQKEQKSLVICPDKVKFSFKSGGVRKKTILRNLNQ